MTKHLRKNLIYSPLLALQIFSFSSPLSAILNKHHPTMIYAGSGSSSFNPFKHSNETDENIDTVKLPSLPWAELQPELDRLIKDAIADPSIEKRIFQLDVARADFRNYCEWTEKFYKVSTYPISYSTANKGAEGDPIDGLYELYHVEITLKNYTKKEDQVRKDFVYKYFEAKFDPTQINARTFYNLMVRASGRVGIEPEFFEKGAHDFQDKIYVKPFMLTSLTCDDANREFEELITQTLKKAQQPFVSLVFSLPEKATYTINDISSNRLHQWPLQPAIYENQENRIYLFLANHEREILDLHDMSPSEARKKVKELIKLKYTNYETTQLSINTGKGNGTPGGVGIMVRAFRTWMKLPEIVPLVEKIKPMGDYGYYIYLKKPGEVDLDNLAPGQNPLVIIREALIDVMKNGDTRLRIKEENDTISGKLTMYLLQNNQTPYGSIYPFSINWFPGEIRLNLLPIDSDESDDDSSSDSQQQPATASKHKAPNSNAPQAPQANVALGQKSKAIQKAGQAPKSKQSQRPKVALTPEPKAEPTQKPKVAPAPKPAQAAKAKAAPAPKPKAAPAPKSAPVPKAKAAPAPAPKAAPVPKAKASQDKARAAQSARDKAKAAAKKAKSALVQKAKAGTASKSMSQ